MNCGKKVKCSQISGHVEHFTKVNQMDHRIWSNFMPKYGLNDNSFHRNFDSIVKTCKGTCIKQNSDGRLSEIPGDLFNLKSILRF